MKHLTPEERLLADLHFRAGALWALTRARDALSVHAIGDAAEAYVVDLERRLWDTRNGEEAQALAEFVQEREP